MHRFKYDLAILFPAAHARNKYLFAESVRGMQILRKSIDLILIDYIK